MSDEQVCRQVERVLGELLDSELDSAKCAVLREHVSECASCRERQLAELSLRRVLRDRLKSGGPGAHLHRRVRVSLHRETLVRLDRLR